MATAVRRVPSRSNQKSPHASQAYMCTRSRPVVIKRPLVSEADPQASQVLDACTASSSWSYGWGLTSDVIGPAGSRLERAARSESVRPNPIRTGLRRCSNSTFGSIDLDDRSMRPLPIRARDPRARRVRLPRVRHAERRSRRGRGRSLLDRRRRRGATGSHGARRGSHAARPQRSSSGDHVGTLSRLRAPVRDGRSGAHHLPELPRGPRAQRGRRFERRCFVTAGSATPRSRNNSPATGSSCASL
jgi:hypothetical protein